MAASCDAVLLGALVLRGLADVLRVDGPWRGRDAGAETSADDDVAAASTTYARAAAAAATGRTASEASHAGVTMDVAVADVGREEASSYAVSFPTSTSMNGREALMEDHSAGTATA